MTINDELLSKLEKLSAVKIMDDKRDETKKQLSEIVGFVEVLNELDLSSQDNSTFGATPFRQDIVSHSNVIDDVFKHAPANAEHFFLVPKIIE